METEEKKQRVRAQNWTAEEEIALIENVKERSLTLFGPIKGSGMKGKIKDIREKEWSCIADRLNSMFDTKRRGLDEIKKKYYNIKSRSKEKLDGVKRPKTGGGPPLPPLTLGEETFLRLSDGEPNIHGLEGGVDTDAPVQCQSSSTAEMSCLSEQSTSEVAEKLENLDKENAKAVEEISIHVPEHSGCKKKKHNKKEKESQRRCLEELERENITLDNQRLQDEIAKIRVEREVLVLKKEVLTLQKQKLVFEIQTSFPCLVEQLSSLPEC